MTADLNLGDRYSYCALSTQNTAEVIRTKVHEAATPKSRCRGDCAKLAMLRSNAASTIFSLKSCEYAVIRL